MKINELMINIFCFELLLCRTNDIQTGILVKFPGFRIILYSTEAFRLLIIYILYFFTMIENYHSINYYTNYVFKKGMSSIDSIVKKFDEFENSMSEGLPKVDQRLIIDMLHRMKRDASPMYTIEIFLKERPNTDDIKSIITEGLGVMPAFVRSWNAHSSSTSIQFADA